MPTTKEPESKSVFIHPRFVPQYSPFEPLPSPHPCEEVLYYARFAKNETQLQSALVNILRHFESWTTPLEYSCHGCRKAFPTVTPSPEDGSAEEQEKVNIRYRCIDCEKSGKDVDFCTQCRRQGNNHDNTHVFQPYKTASTVAIKDETDRRHALISFGVLQFAFSELRSTTPVHEDKTVLLLWRLIFRLAFNANAEDELAYGPTLEAVEEGLIEAFVMEATRVPLRLKIASIALSPMTVVCLRKECVPALIRTGAVDCFVKMSLLPISETDQDTGLQIVSHAISCLRNLALHPECRFVLLEKGAVNAAVSLISANLASKDAVRIDIGFLCASLICRLVGNEEVDSPAAKIIRSNVQVIQEYEKRLSNILLHPDKNAQWNPANLVYDISILAKSDKNKPLLKRFIPLIVTGFEQRAKRNSRFVMFGINTLSLLWFDETCRPALGECYDRLIRALDEILQLESTSIETNRTAQVLRGSLVEWKQNQPPGATDRAATSEQEVEDVLLMAGGPDDEDDDGLQDAMLGGPPPPPAPAGRAEITKAPSAKRMGRVGGMPSAAGGGRSGKGSFRLFSRKTSSTAVITNKQRESSGAHLAVKHAMISYSWDCNPEIAEMMELMLREAGIPTWFDKNDMGENINDSMADAIERAFVVLILYSEAYKESGNCRREADMADELKRPKIFIRVQDGYEGNGWLRLMMGKSLWIDCSSMNRLEKNKHELLKRVARASHGLIAPPPTSPTSASSSNENQNGGVTPSLINKTATITKPASSISLLMRGMGKGGSQSTLQTSTNNRASGDFANKSSPLVGGDEGLLLLVLKQLQSEMKEMKTEMQSLKGEISKLRQDVVDSSGKKN